MKIAYEFGVGASLGHHGKVNGGGGGSEEPFAELLNGLLTSSGEAGGVKDPEAADDEKGFVGYFQKLREERMEELRRDILEGMGLTEEDLAKMSPRQRAAVEEAIARQIQERMAAESTLEKGGGVIGLAGALGGRTAPGGGVPQGDQSAAFGEPRGLFPALARREEET